jgi:hypothetical protein
MVEQLGADRLLVRSSRTSAPITAVRQGDYIRYRSVGTDVGHSVLKDGRIHHYLHDAQGTRYMGYDRVVNGRVLQYDAEDLLIREMTLRVPTDIGGAAAALVVAPLALVSSDPDRRQQAEGLLAQIATIRKRLKHQ